MRKTEHEPRPPENWFTSETDDIIGAKRPELQVQRHRTSWEIRDATRQLIPDNPALLDSLGRLEQAGLLFAFHLDEKLMRIITREADRHRAIVQGFTIWSPRDMFEYVHLPEEQRKALLGFKRIFSEGSFEWEALRT